MIDINLDELPAYIEGLQESVKWRDQQLSKQASEIERLRKEADENQWRKDWHILAAELEQLRAEVSALKADAYAAAEVGFAVARHDAAKQKAEIERLRGLADVARLDVMWQELVRERDDAKREIERLREISRPGSCECSTEDACRFARERDEARAEIERLRALLRQRLHTPNMTVEAMEEWEQQANEAIGDE